MTRYNTSDYDIVFAGGGAAACVTAGRLADADPNLKILILESGPHTKDGIHHIQPGRYFSQLSPASNPGTLAFNKGKPSPSLLGREAIVPSAHAFGGGSSLNFVVYTRPSASDFDDWEKIYGNTGWGSDKMIPLLKKAETYQADTKGDTHGTNGPIKISFAKEHMNVGTEFLAAATAYDKQRGFTDDPNSFHSINEFGPWARYVDGETGRRSDTAHHYIYNKGNLTNVHILAESRVVRILFEGSNATAVEYVNDRDDEPTVVKARRLVVVSAGAFGSPAILERSGIGASNVLAKNGVKKLVDLPGVGENYMDHVGVFLPFYGSEETESLDHVFRGSDKDLEEHDKQWFETGTGLLTQNAIDAGGKLRPTPEELKTMSPEFNARWSSYFANAPDKPAIVTLSYSSYMGRDPSVPIGKYYSIAYFLGYPASTGQVHISSGTDAYSPPDFNPGYLEDPADVALLRWGYKKIREYGRRMKLYRGEISSGHPDFSLSSTAAVRTRHAPSNTRTPGLVYTREDDTKIDEFHRKSAHTTWHSCGTCAMKPRESSGVVDERLNVYGVSRLKVADISIIPGNVGANTYNAAIGVGEKAAVIIAQDLGIEGVSEGPERECTFISACSVASQ